MIVVSDSSPLIALSAIDQHQLLPALFGTVYIPNATWLELAAAPNEPNRAGLLAGAWLRRQPINRPPRPWGDPTLGPGETEAIALALELPADLTLLDDLDARAVAHRLGVPHIGVLGVLLRAKQEGLLDAVAPCLLRLREAVDFRISPALKAYALRKAGEE